MSETNDNGQGIDPIERPMVVHASSAGAQVGSMVRDLALILSAVPVILGILGKRDFTALVKYLASDDFAPVAGVLVSLAVIAWRQWNARHTKARLVAAARAEPGSVIVIDKNGSGVPPAESSA